jgi:hypothetical protein
MTILDTPIDVLERRGYDGNAVTAIQDVMLIPFSVQRILKEYDDNLCKAGNGSFITIVLREMLNDSLGKTIPNGLQAPNAAPSPKDGPAPPRMGVPRKLAKWLQWLHKDPKLGEVKLSDIGKLFLSVLKIGTKHLLQMAPSIR